jgi:hypothetical protein
VGWTSARAREVSMAQHILRWVAFIAFSRRNAWTWSA